MKYVLRDYQQECSDVSVEFLKSKGKKNGVIVLPTGSGKSLVIAEIAKQLDEPLVIFQPSKEILEQNFEKLVSYGIYDVGVYSASLNSKKIDRITLATIGSAVSHPDLFERFKYTLVDECHGVNPKFGRYKDFFDLVKTKILGLTATPFRLASNSFGSELRFITRTRPKVFDELLYYVQIKDLLDRGYLAKMVYHDIKSIDCSQLKVNSTGADYTDKSVQDYYEKVRFKNKLKRVVDRLLELDRKGVLIFTRFVNEAKFIVDNSDGQIEMVTAKTKKKERSSLIKRFRAGEIKAIANVGVLTTGFDYPELDTILIARPTRSLGLFYQMVGRAVRPHQDKEHAMIVDMGGNLKRFGKIEDLKLTARKNKLWHIESNGRQLTNVYMD